METPQVQPEVSPSSPTQQPGKEKKEKRPKQPRTYRVSWPVLFILVLLAAAFYGAWSYARINKQQSQLSAKEEQLNNKQKELDSIKSDRDEAADNLIKASAEAGYTVIKSWDVKFKTSTDLERFVYLEKSGQVVPSTTSLMQLAWEKAPTTAVAGSYLCSPADYPLGYIARGKADEKAQIGAADQFPLYKDVAGAVKAGDYYYIAVGPQATCSQDKTVSDLETKQIAALKEAVKTLVPAK